MIKILFYIDELTAGGAEKVLCNLVNNMDPSSFDITVHTTWKSDAESLLKPHVKYKYVYSNKTKINRYLYRAETQLGLFCQLHLKGSYDIEVAYLECGPTKVMASSTNKKAAHIAWIHCDLEKKFANMNVFADKTRSQYKKYDRVICVSEECNKTYQKYFSDCAPSQVLYNVIDDEEIRRLAKEPLPDNVIKRRFTLLSLGRLTYQKAYDMLLKVHKRLIDDGFEYDLWIAGEGSERSNLESYIAEQDLKDSVKLLGFTSNPYPLIENADLLVCSSRYEGFSTFITEGLIIGKPIVSTDCTGMRELLGNSEFGLLSDISEDSLYEKMKMMLSDSNLLERYRVLSKEHGKQFNKNLLLTKTEKLFKELATNRF